MNMTYRELQIALKAYKEQGLTNVNLNAKKDVLIAEYGLITARMAEVESVVEVENVEVSTPIVNADYYRKTVRYYNEQAINAMMNKASNEEVKTYIELANIAIEKMKAINEKNEKQEIKITEKECLFTGDLHINNYLISEDTKRCINGRCLPVTYSVYNENGEKIAGNFADKNEAKNHIISLLRSQPHKSKILISI